ncbi:MAG: helix-turn-helix transcriptional regulator [Clostridiales bacterium]|nr:helix-turn-helix transcriptional regulator [Clostridiales bacterium]
MNIQKNFKKFRTEKQLSQEELAKLVGTTRQTIISIEKEVFIPSSKLAFLLCIALDTKFEDMFYFDSH